VFERLMRGLLRAAMLRPGRLLVAAVLLSVPAGWQASHIRLDTDLKRLLPRDSRAVRWSRELEPVVGDGGYFSLLLEGGDPAALDRAVEEAARLAGALPGVGSVEYRIPVEFVRRYKHTLLPSGRLEDVLDRVNQLETEVNPLIEDLADGAAGAPSATRVDAGDVDRELERWVGVPPTYRSADGRVRGVIVRPLRGVTSLGATRHFFGRLQALVAETARRHALRGYVSGSLRSKVEAYLQIRQDLNRAGYVAAAGIALTLLVAFRSLRPLPLVLVPVAAGLLWSYGLVPALVGDLNIMTAFLLMVLFGMGIEFSVHLVKRFLQEAATRPLAAALEETFLSTGRSILTSGFATTLGTAILCFSRLRGFSEFGAISAVSIFAIFLAMFLVLPPMLVVWARRGWIGGPSRAETGGMRWVPRRLGTIAALAASAAAGVVALRWLTFDYDFQNLQADVPAVAEASARHREVFSGYSAPGAVYAVSDLATLDRALVVVGEAKRRHPAVIGTVASVRDLAPGPAEWAKRGELLRELQDRLRASWTRRVKDPKKREWIADIVGFRAPDAAPRVEDLPAELRRRVAARDGSGAWILSVDTAGRPREGRMAMAFTEALYELRMPAGVRGPTGDKPVFAEILRLVTREGPWLVGATLLGVFALVLADRRRIGESLWVMLPLSCGLALTFGVMAALGWKLNFFNVIVFPSLIGNAVDNGVHWFRRFRETGEDTAEVQHELSGTLTASTATTATGYAGMILAHHAGLRSIGSVAVLGLMCCLFTGVVVMPGVLRLLARRHQRVKDGTGIVSLAPTARGQVEETGAA
jgi:predicted RND superfamily exporter protein